MNQVPVLRWLVLLLVLCMGLTMLPQANTLPAYGDADQNGTVDAKDALLALQHAVLLAELSAQQLLLAEVSGDNTINAVDALLILQYAVQNISSFPVEQMPEPEPEPEPTAPVIDAQKDARFYSDSKSLTITTAYEGNGGGSIANPYRATSTTWYTWDRNTIYFYVEFYEPAYVNHQGENIDIIYYMNTTQQDGSPLFTRPDSGGYLRYAIGKGAQTGTSEDAQVPPLQTASHIDVATGQTRCYEFSIPRNPSADGFVVSPVIYCHSSFVVSYRDWYAGLGKTVLFEDASTWQEVCGEHAVPPTTLELIANRSAQYRLYSPHEELTALTNTLQNHIAAAYGTPFATTETPEEKTVCLILDPAIGPNGYTFSIRQSSLYISASDATAMAYALGMLEQQYIQKQKNSGFLQITSTMLPKRARPDPFTIAEALQAGLAITPDHVPVFDYGIRTVDDVAYRISQGVCTDGTYVYFLMRAANDAAVIVVKTDLNGNEIKISAPADMGHANDMTFDSQNNRLVILHGTSTKNTFNGNDNGRRVTFMNPNTLQVTYTKKDLLPPGYAAGAIAYHPTTGTYYTGRGGTAFRQITISRDFAVTGLCNQSRADQAIEGSDGYTSQGMGTDGTYIYFPMSGPADNLLVVYDLSGNYLQTLTLPTAMESESVFSLHGTLYVLYYANGAVLGKVTFTADYR